MDTPEQMHRKYCQSCAAPMSGSLSQAPARHRGDRTVMSGEQDLGDLIGASRAWQQAVKSGDLDAIGEVRVQFYDRLGEVRGDEESKFLTLSDTWPLRA